MKHYNTPHISNNSSHSFTLSLCTLLNPSNTTTLQYFNPKITFDILISPYQFLTTQRRKQAGLTHIPVTGYNWAQEVPALTQLTFSI